MDIVRGGHVAKKIRDIKLSRKYEIYELTASEQSYDFFHRHPITGKKKETKDEGQENGNE